jgi:hypothetical protein
MENVESSARMASSLSPSRLVSQRTDGNPGARVR